MCDHLLALKSVLRACTLYSMGLVGTVHGQRRSYMITRDKRTVCSAIKLRQPQRPGHLVHVSRTVCRRWRSEYSAKHRSICCYTQYMHDRILLHALRFFGMQSVADRLACTDSIRLLPRFCFCNSLSCRMSAVHTRARHSGSYTSSDGAAPDHFSAYSSHKVQPGDELLLHLCIILSSTRCQWSRRDCISSAQPRPSEDACFQGRVGRPYSSTIVEL